MNIEGITSLMDPIHYEMVARLDYNEYLDAKKNLI